MSSQAVIEVLERGQEWSRNSSNSSKSERHLAHAISEALTKLREQESREQKFDEMVKRSGYKKWDLWHMAFGAAMNTEGSFRFFLRDIRDGTALDFWENDFPKGLADGTIVPRVAPQNEGVSDG